MIEGPSHLFHPAYAGVTLGLIHGSQPDPPCLCRDPTRASIDGYTDFPIPSLATAVGQYLAARLTDPRAPLHRRRPEHLGPRRAAPAAAIASLREEESALPMVDPS